MTKIKVPEWLKDAYENFKHGLDNIVELLSLFFSFDMLMPAVAFLLIVFFSAMLASVPWPWGPSAKPVSDMCIDLDRDTVVCVIPKNHPILKGLSDDIQHD